VHVEQVIANHKSYDVPSDSSGQVRLPALIHDLQIDYTALSLVAPKKYCSATNWKAGIAIGRTPVFDVKRSTAIFLRASIGFT